MTIMGSANRTGGHPGKIHSAVQGPDKDKMRLAFLQTVQVLIFLVLLT